MSQYSVIDESGFFDLPQSIFCPSSEHNPPSHLHIPAGKGYRHVCPHCGAVSIVQNVPVVA